MDILSRSAGILVVIILITGCQKDVTDPEPAPIEPPAPGPTEFGIGDTTGLYVTNFDTTYFFTGPEGQWISHQLDLDGTAGADLYLRMYFGYSLAQGGISRWELVKATGSDLLFNGNFTADTIRHFYDSTLTYDMNAIPPYSLSVTYTEGCGIAGSIDSILPVFEIEILQDGSSVDTTSYLDPPKAISYWSGLNYNAPVYPLINDSTRLYSYYTYLADCFELPLGEQFHIAIARMEGGALKQGWIRLELPLTGGVRVGLSAIEL